MAERDSNFPCAAQQCIDRLLEFQRAVRTLLIASRNQNDLHSVARTTSADTIYAIDAAVEPLLEDFCREWSKTTPLVLIAEGVEDERGQEGGKVFPPGTLESDALIRVIIDPIDGTRGLMYDKRSAWTLAGVAPNHGAQTCLRDIYASAMTELPTSKLGFADVLWAIKGRGAHGQRANLSTGEATDLPLRPSSADRIDHGFATISNFFPGTKALASELMEHLVHRLIGPVDVGQATVFDDQYISTGGQFYELIIGHDRFIADLRPVFYQLEGKPPGLCCHPYDCATMLIAEEAGVILTDACGHPLDGPLDVTTGISWAGYANPTLRNAIEPLITAFLRESGGRL